MMRFWGCESLFWTILWRRRSLQFQWARAWFFCVCTIMLDKETWRKDCWFLLFICSLFWFLYTAKCEFSSKLGVYIKDWSPSRGYSLSIRRFWGKRGKMEAKKGERWRRETPDTDAFTGAFHPHAAWLDTIQSKSLPVIGLSASRVKKLA